MSVGAEVEKLQVRCCIAGGGIATVERSQRRRNLPTRLTQRRKFFGMTG